MEKIKHGEKINLINKPELSKTIEDLFKAIETHPKKDNNPIYTPIEVEIEYEKQPIIPADSWQKGQPGKAELYIPAEQKGPE